MLKTMFMNRKYVGKLKTVDASELIISIHASGVEDHGILLRRTEQK